MDIQLTDFENSCLIILLGLITNVINHFDVDFIIPITLSDENMKRAHYRDAILTEKFWFNVNCVTDPQAYTKSSLQESNYTKSSTAEKEHVPKYEELYIHEIFCGKPDSNFMGINAMIRDFMKVQNWDKIYVDQFENILGFIQARAKGEVPTGARFIRDYVLQHMLYKENSKISPCLNRALLM